MILSDITLTQSTNPRPTVKTDPISDSLIKTTRSFIAGAALMLCATSCSTNTWQKSQAICSHKKDDLGKFGPEGHMNTTYVVARIAGNSERTSLRLSHFSQAPDDLAFAYSAPSVAIWGALAPPAWGYRHRIVNVLHSLHGGNTSEVAARRANLKKLISEIKHFGGKDWKIGFLIHAYGDSYAHVKGDLGHEMAYGELVGHGFDHSMHPDEIEEHVPNYLVYVRNLYDALETTKGNRPELNRFIKEVEIAGKGPDPKKKVAQAIVCFKFDQTSLLELDLKDIGKRTMDWNNEIKIGQVDHFLREVDKRL